MTEEIINKLPEQLGKHICTLKKASTDTTNDYSMCDSLIEVVNFDKLPNEYSRGRGWNSVPNSNDALYIDIEDKWYFIEFKNGSIHKEEIYRKMYDSLIMLIELNIIPDFNFIRENIKYILVYNGEKYGKQIQKAPSRDKSYNYFMKLAQQEEKLFGIDKFEGYLFNETHTYTQGLFEDKFIKLKEQEEGIVS